MNNARVSRSTVAGAALLCALAAPAAFLGQLPHRHEITRAGDEAPGLKVRRVLVAPPGFKGTVTYDAASGRLFLVSFGPPANVRGKSTLYEL